MFYRLPVELATPNGQVVVTGKVIDMSEKALGKSKSMDVEAVKKWWGNKKLDIIVVVHDDPRDAYDCIHAINRHMPKWVGAKLTVVNNNSEKFTTDLLDDLCDKHRIDQLITMDEYEGTLPAIYVGTQETKGHWIVYVDQCVIVTEGWLERLLGAASTDKNVAMVSPWSSKRIPPFVGSNYVDMASRIQRTTRMTRHKIALPGLFCLAVERKSLNAIGGFDVENYSPGGGEIADLYMRMLQSGKRIIRADDCYVLDKSVGVSDAGEWLPKPAGYVRFMKQWEGKAKQAYEQRAKFDRTENVVLAAREVKPKRPKVIFIMREAPVCGMVLATVHICNQLIELGWDATFACTKLDGSHKRHLPMHFAPYIFKDYKQMNGVLKQRLKDSFVVAPTWITVNDVMEICENREDLQPIYFVQDDERKFRYPSGELYSDPKEVEATYGMFDSIVVNSEWVQKELKKLKHNSTYIGIGVDTLMFHPSKLPNDRIRIMAHSRPSTPRRGWPFIAEVMNRLAGYAIFEFVTYDEEPENLRLPWHGHLGRVSPRELAREMSHTHIFFEGSEIQGWGMQALEAMASGCALVCTDNLGIHNFGTSGHDCIIIPHDDVKRTVAVLLRLVEKNKERSTIAANARETAKNFDWSTVGFEWDAYLKNRNIL